MDFFAFCWEWESRRTGRERAKPFQNGFPRRIAGWRPRFMTAGRRSAARSRRFSSFLCIFAFGWRVAFVIPGLLGFLWLIAWRRFYYLPQDHPRVSDEERAMILADAQSDETTGKPPLRWAQLLKLPQTWGTIVAKGLTDPVWFFVTDWFPIYLVAKGISLKSGLIAVWIPFLAADLGNFFGGAASGYLVRRGWSLGAARKALVVFGGIGVMLLIPTIFTGSLYADHAAVRASDIFLCGIFDDCERLAGGLVSERIGGFRQRPKRNRRGNRDNYCVRTDRPLFRCAASVRDPFVRSDRDCGRIDPVCRHDSGVAAGAEYQGYRSGIGAENLRLRLKILAMDFQVITVAFSRAASLPYKALPRRYRVEFLRRDVRWRAGRAP